MKTTGPEQERKRISIGLAVVIGILLLLIAGIIGYGLGNRGEAPAPEEPPTPSEQPEPQEPAPQPTPQEPEPQEPEPAQPIPVEVSEDLIIYLTRGEKIGAASREVTSEDSLEAQATALVEQLLAGPVEIEEEFGLSTTIPDGTDVHGVTVNGTTATVDLSSTFESGGGSLSMQLRVAQIVWTLTQFDEIDSVAFALDGEVVQSIGGEGVMVDPALTREDCEDQAPAILVEYPFVNQEVKSPLVIRGSSNTFEAMMMVDIVDNSGVILKTEPVMATSGTGTRGTFEAEIPFDATRDGLGAIIFYEASAMDGSAINVVEIPVWMED